MGTYYTVSSSGSVIVRVPSQKKRQEGVVPRPKPGTDFGYYHGFESKFLSGRARDSKCLRFVYYGEYEVIVSVRSETRLAVGSAVM